MKVYKVRSKKDGKFTTGGYFTFYSSVGKVYSKKAAAITVAKALNQRHHDVEVVEYELQEVGVLPCQKPS